MKLRKPWGWTFYVAAFLGLVGCFWHIRGDYARASADCLAALLILLLGVVASASTEDGEGRP